MYKSLKINTFCIDVGRCSPMACITSTLNDKHDWLPILVQGTPTYPPLAWAMKRFEQSLDIILGTNVCNNDEKLNFTCLMGWLHPILPTFSGNIVHIAYVYFLCHIEIYSLKRTWKACQMISQLEYSSPHYFWPPY